MPSIPVGAVSSPSSAATSPRIFSIAPLADATKLSPDALAEPAPSRSAIVNVFPPTVRPVRSSFATVSSLSSVSVMRLSLLRSPARPNPASVSESPAESELIALSNRAPNRSPSMCQTWKEAPCTVMSPVPDFGTLAPLTSQPSWSSRVIAVRPVPPISTSIGTNIALQAPSASVSEYTLPLPAVTSPPEANGSPPRV